MVAFKILRLWRFGSSPQGSKMFAFRWMAGETVTGTGFWLVGDTKATSFRLSSDRRLWLKPKRRDCILIQLFALLKAVDPEEFERYLFTHQEKVWDLCNKGLTSVA